MLRPNKQRQALLSNEISPLEIMAGLHAVKSCCCEMLPVSMKNEIPSSFFMQEGTALHERLCAVSGEQTGSTHSINVKQGLLRSNEQRLALLSNMMCLMEMMAGELAVPGELAATGPQQAHLKHMR